MDTSNRSGNSSTSSIDSEVSTGTRQIVHYMKCSTYPVLILLLAAGLILSLVTFARPKVRKHSSSAFLLAMVILDAVWVSGGYVLPLVATLSPDLHITDSTCRVPQALDFIGKTGASLVVLMLGLERVLILAIPQRMEKMLPKVLMVVSLLSLLTICAGSSYTALEYKWDPKLRKQCVYKSYHDKQKNSSPWLIVILPIVIICIQIILIALLTILIYKKRRNQSIDPLHSTLSELRQNTNPHLNRINSITILMTVMVSISNISYVTAWWYFQQDPEDTNQALIVHEILVVLTLLITASKVFCVALVSRSIRRETLKALTCSEYRSRRHLAEHIRPKPKPKDVREDNTQELSVYPNHSSYTTEPAGVPDSNS